MLLQDIVQAYADTVHVAMTLRAPRMPPWPRDDERPAKTRNPEWPQWSVAIAWLIGLSSWD
jgi:hypothetical protein